MANPWDSDPVVGGKTSSPAEFAQVYGPAAERAGKALGVDSKTLLGQWGLETGWGKSIVPGTHNLGNIKDFAGGGTAATDNMTGSKDKYRTYASPDAFADDYVSLVQRKYPGAVGAGEDLAKFTGALTKGGYAEDPRYADKVTLAAGIAKSRSNPVLNAVGGAVNAVMPSANAATVNPWDNDPIVEAPKPTAAAPAQAVQPSPNEPATDRQKLLSSVPMRLAKGGKDPMDGAAQLLQRILPDKVVNAVNRAADYVGGEGTFAGDVLGIKGMTPKQMTADIKDSNAEYEAARMATAPTTTKSLVTGRKDPGMDLARLAGNVLSPVNAAVGRVLPIPKAGDTLSTLAMKGAASGAAGAATQPVMSDSYWMDKGTQVGVGAAAGGVLTPVLSKAAEGVAKYVRSKLGSGAASKTPEALELEIKTSLARDDIDIGQIPKSVMDKLTAEAKQAMSSGQELDAAALLRKMDFEKVGVKPTLGQISRDPNQFTKEMNLRGVQGVGEPITNRLNEQASTIASRFRQSTAGAESPYVAGRSLVERLQSKDAEMAGDVRSAYKAFKDSTGKELEVPLQGMAQDYAKTLRDFGEAIPSAVRNQFEELGLLTGKQSKLLSIDDAENLIKTINKHYNPADKAQATALNELRGHVQNAILNVTDNGAGMEAATLANLARGSAKQRFSAIENTPALKAAINSAEPDDFVKKFVINGKVREIGAMADMVGPEGKKTMQQQMLKYLENKAFGANAAGDGAGRQASFNSELNSIGKEKLTALLGPQQTEDLFAIGRVMAYIQQQPAGSAVNNSNTGAMIASMLGKIGGTIKGAPYISDFVVKPIGAFKDRAAVSSALSAQLPKQAAQLDPETINSLARYMRPAPVAAGAASGYAVR